MTHVTTVDISARRWLHTTASRDAHEPIQISGMIRIASFNVENLFARPNAFGATDLSDNQPIIEAYSEFNSLIKKASYSESDKTRLRDLLVTLDVYYVNDQGAIRRKQTQRPKWAWLRKNRGKFDREPRDNTQNVEIIADGRDDWIGWVELAKEPVDETAVRMTAKVIGELQADIIGVIEAEDRPAMVRFNEDFLEKQYHHVMLVDGNDERGIDVAIMTRAGFPITSIRSNVDLSDGQAIVFSRDCPQYQVQTPNGEIIHFLVNHFKSQSGGGGAKRRRQADAVRQIVDDLVQRQQHVVVLGDLNEGPTAAGGHAANLSRLYDNNSPLIACYELPGFDDGGRPGTYDSCGLRNRLDYIFISQSLQASFSGGHLFRKGLWGSRVTRPTNWDTYPEMTSSKEAASDHASVVIELEL